MSPVVPLYKPTPPTPPAWRLPVLLLVLLVLLGGLGALFISRALHRSVVVQLPFPDDDAGLEPPPAEGVEGEALGEARSLIDNYALDEATTVLRRVLRDNPRSARAHAYLARLAYRRGQRTDGTCDANAVAGAERELLLADALQPDLSDSKLVRGYLAYFGGDFSRAKRLGLAAERDPTIALRASLLLAQAASSAGSFDEADRRATAIVYRVREGFLSDGAYGVLDEVYAGRHELRRLAALRKLVAERRARASGTRPR